MNDETTSTRAPLGWAKIADDAVGLFLEYRDAHGYDEERAREQAVADVAEVATYTRDDLTPGTATTTEG